MKKYLKPTIVFAAASAGGPSSCLNNAADLELIQDILGAGYDINSLFGIAETCEIGVDYYCKYTSVESGSEQVFIS